MTGFRGKYLRFYRRNIITTLILMANSTHIVMPTQLLRMIRKTVFLSGLVSIPFLSAAQTNISGIVNSYYKVIDIIPAKACVRLNTTAGLAQNDKALLIQMKGATINTSN